MVRSRARARWPRADVDRRKVHWVCDEADLAIANGSKLVVIHLGNVFAAELVAAGTRCIEATEHVHERRFTAAAWSHDGQVFVAAYLQGHAAQRAHDFLAHDVIFGDILNVDHDRAERSD